MLPYINASYKEIICIKKCVSSKYHIAYEGETYKSSLEHVVKIKSYSYYPAVETYTVYPTIAVYNSTGFIGNFDRRNFMTLAEYRDYRIDKIFE